VLIGAALAWLYARTLAGLVVEWTSSPDASYGLVMAIAALAVGWQRRRAFMAARDTSASAVPGLAFLIGGLLLYLVGLLGADVFLTRLSLLPVVTGILWLIAGPRAVRVVAAPLVFALVAIPLPALIVNAVTLPLQIVASRLAESTLMLAGVPVFRDGNVLELPSATLEVAEACSGLRSLVSLTGVGVLVAWTVYGRAWKRTALITAALPIAIVMNGFRIAATGIACEVWGRAAASGGWHTFTGWVTFAASVMVLLQLRRVVERRPTAPPISRTGEPLPV